MLWRWPQALESLWMRELSAEAAWEVLRSCARLPAQGDMPRSFAWRGARLLPIPSDASDAADAIVHWDGVAGWRCVDGLSGAIADFLELYLPVCAASAARPVTVAHLGQSLDGYIATSNGDSQYVSDPQNIVHLHRMRALCDAVVVGGATVRDDDPQLTTRLATGDNPLRVIIDPKHQLSPAHRVFNDGAAMTLLVTLEGTSCAQSKRVGFADHVQVLRVRADANGNPDLQALLRALHSRGCHAVFVEGGGITVSRFVDAGLLDRMQIAVAPLFIGRGRAGMRIAGSQSLQDCLRPSYRLFRMGADLLFDCDLRTPAEDHRYCQRSERVHDADAQSASAAPLPQRMA